MPDAMREDSLSYLPAANSATDLVARSLCSSIVRGQFAEGERLRQDAIASRFGVSQMVARAAFQQLTAQGFLKAEPRKGVSVSRLSAEEAHEIMRLRILLECEALSCAIPNMTERDLQHASRILDDLDAATATDEIIRQSAHFHATLYAPCRQERTLSILSMLRLNYERYLRYSWEKVDNLAHSQETHRELLRLCAGQDVAKAVAVLVHEIETTGKMISGLINAIR